MALPHTSESQANHATPVAGCPVAYGGQKGQRGLDLTAPLVECDGKGVWHIRGFAEARAVLQSDHTKQAGFNAEMVALSSGLSRQPVLYQEGKEHLEQRKQTARFFTPKTVSTSYQLLMEQAADRIVNQLKRTRRADLSQLSLSLAVQVAGQVVGLTNSRMPGMAGRLEAFFRLPSPNDRPLWLTSVRQVLNLRHLLAFYWLDVLPAIEARRRQPQEDVISHLLAHNYTNREILTECVTYAAAGMVTTREFISMAAWHFLDKPALRARYLVAGDEERTAMLHEILRLEPIVAHLYRRSTAEVRITSAGQPVVIPEGALIQLHVDAGNADARVTGAEPLALCPGRELHAPRAGQMLLSFGDGHHRCPGAYIAIQESDIFLRRLLRLKSLQVEKPPTLTWNELTTGYDLRQFWLRVTPRSAVRPT
ncbi:MAG: cytochrome P450 [Chloroflexota bacterium]|nr:cytochrome P450 [Chloroflexota bacterium]